jgi:hypothetical protein
MRLTLIGCAAVALTACGGGSGGGTPTGKVRIVNLFSPDGGAGPAIDVYAAPSMVFQPLDTSAKPLISNLAYSKASDYISPPAAPDNSGVLAFLEAGQKAATHWYSGDPVPGSFHADDQATILIYNSPDSSGTPLVGFETIWEKGTNEQVNPNPLPASGKAMFYPRTEVMDPYISGQIWWWGDNGAPCLVTHNNGALNGYEVPAGSSMLTLLLKASGSGNPTCGEPPTKTLSIMPGADAQAWLIAWGSSQSDLNLWWLPF